MDPRGSIAALSAAASWAVASIAISRLLARGRVTPAAANLFKNGLAAAFFFVAALVLGGRWPVGAAWGWLFLSGLLGFAISDTLYFAAFRLCGVQTAATVLLLNVPFAALLAVPIVGDRLDPAMFPHIAIVMIGVVLVILDSRTGRAPGEGHSVGDYLTGVLFAFLAAAAIGLALPLGRHRFDEVGVWPGSFIRLAGGAIGAVPLAALSGLRKDSSPSTEVGRLVEPLFRAPGPSSVWGRTALFGVSVAILGLIPYHYALRELPSGIASILFATTPLFTLPLSLVVRQRVGVVAAIGSVLGFIGVAGLLALQHGVGGVPSGTPGEDRLDEVRPVTIPLAIEAPPGARYPTFIAGAEARPVEGAAPGHPPMLAIVDAIEPSGKGDAGKEDAGTRDAGEGDAGFPARLLALGLDDTAQPTVQDVLGGGGEAAANDLLHVHFADVARGARLPSGALVFTYLERLEPDGLDAGVRVSIAEDGPPSRALGWLAEHPALAPHGYVTLVPGDAAGNAVAAWLDDRVRPDDDGGVQLLARTIGPSGEFGPEVVLDPRVVASCPTAGARMGDGAMLFAYRDLSDDDLVDIHVVARDPGGRWSEPVRVHADGWAFRGPLVNGPALAIDGDLVAVAWYVQLGGTRPAVRVAFSRDGGVTFDPPQTLREGATRGHVELCAMGDGIFALVHDAPPPEGAEPSTPDTWELALVAPGARASAFLRIGTLLGRSSGGLDLAPGPPGIAFAAWTGPTGLEAARIELPRPPATADAPPGDEAR